MSLEQLLSEIRQRRLILTSGRTGRVVLWSPCTTVSRQIRQAIAYHNPDLQRLVEGADIRVCPNQALHRHSWQHDGGQRYTCAICARLNVAIWQRSIA